VTEAVSADSAEDVTVLVVDDQPPNLRLMDAVLSPRGYKVIAVESGQKALTALKESRIDVVLLDIVMPGMDGHEVCRQIRSDEATAFLPVVMITASGPQEKLHALESGADDFITKPFDQAELIARVASLSKVKRYHDTIRRQAEELAAWNRELTERVDSQVAELQRVGRLRRFLAPQVANLVLSTGDESVLDSHRREIVVVFCDLRGFTRFAESSEPEEVMAVLNEYHAALGDLVFRFEGTLERFTGDGVMVFFNDPMPCEDAALRAVRMAVAMRSRIRELADAWAKRGYDLGLGIGVAQGFATLGRIGFEGRFDYAAIGSVTNMSARLCAAAATWQILVTQRVFSSTESFAVGDSVGELTLHGFSQPIRAFGIKGLDQARLTT
jgi:adenylate cyclase